jgi:hypothetical protein
MLKALIVCCLLGQAPSLPKGVTVEYDKFDDTTYIRLDLGDFTGDAGTHIISVNAIHEGRDPKAVSAVVFHVYRYGREWAYMKHHDVVMMCGDDRMKIIRQRYDFKLQTKYNDKPWTEYINIFLKVDDLQSMLERGKDIEFKIGIEGPYTLGRQARDKMLRFVKAVGSGAY